MRERRKCNEDLEKNSSEIWYCRNCREGTSWEFMLMMMRRRRLPYIYQDWLLIIEFLVIDHVPFFWRENCTRLEYDKCHQSARLSHSIVHHTCSVDNPLRVPMHKLLGEARKNKIGHSDWHILALIITMSKRIS